MASEKQGASRAEHSGSTTSSGESSVKRRSTVGVRNLALHTADASCTCEVNICVSGLLCLAIQLCQLIHRGW